MYEYDFKAYGFDGTFKNRIKGVTFDSFTGRINGGIEDLEVKFPYGNWDREDYDQFKIEKTTNNQTGETYFHGLNSVAEGIEYKDGAKVGYAKCFGYISELNKGWLEWSNKMVRISRNQTIERITKEVLLDYFAFNSDISVEYDPSGGGDTNSTFGGLRRLAQKFHTPTDTEQCLVTRADAYLRYTNAGIPADISFAIYDDDGGSPSKPNNIVSTLETGIEITQTSYDWFKLIFLEDWATKGVELDPDTDYWLVVYSTGSSATNVYNWRSDSSGTYADGYYSVSTNGGISWTTDTRLDLLFKIFYRDESKVQIDWTTDSIDALSNTLTIEKESYSTWKEWIDYIVDHSPAGYYYYLDEENIFHFHKVGSAISEQIDACDSMGDGTAGWNAIDTEVWTEWGVKEGTGTIKSVGPIYRQDAAIDGSDYECIGPAWIYIHPDYIGGLKDITVTLDTSKYPASGTTESVVILASKFKVGWNNIFNECKFNNNTVKSAFKTVLIIPHWTGSQWFGGEIAIDDVRMGDIYTNHHDVEFETEIEFDAERDVSGLKNFGVLTNAKTGGSRIIGVAQNEKSIEDYSRRCYYKRDDRISTQATADANVEKEINWLSEPMLKCSSLIVKHPYPVETIRPGHTITIHNIPTDLEKYFNEKMPISQVTYHHDFVELELIEDMRDPSSDLAKYKSEVNQQISQNENYTYQT